MQQINFSINRRAKLGADVSHRIARAGEFLTGLLEWRNDHGKTNWLRAAELVRSKYSRLGLFRGAPDLAFLSLPGHATHIHNHFHFRPCVAIRWLPQLDSAASRSLKFAPGFRLVDEKLAGHRAMAKHLSLRGSREPLDSIAHKSWNRRPNTLPFSLPDRIVFSQGFHRVVTRTPKWLASFDNGPSLRRLAVRENNSRERELSRSMVLPYYPNWTIQRNRFGNAPAHICELRTTTALAQRLNAVEHSESHSSAEVFTWKAGQNTALPSNIGQISDHVIAQLDRRMMAWRERLGKV